MPFQYKNRGAILRGTRNKLRAAMEGAAQDAAREMEMVIQIANRIESGDMVSAPIEASSVKISGTRYTVFWGWPLSERKAHSDRMTSNTEPYRSYYDLQDLGFQHWRSGKWIEGMHAVEAGKQEYMRSFRQRWGK